MTSESTRRERRLMHPSNLALAAMLVAAAIGTISLVRQRPDPRLATPVPPPAWALAGHDAARSGHSLSYPAKLPITRRWWLEVQLGVRRTVVDGAGNIYLARPDGALLALDANGNTRGCAAMQPITDTSCSGTLLSPSSRPTLPPTTPNPTIIVGPDYRTYIMVVGAGGVLRPLTPSSFKAVDHKFLNLVPDDGVVYHAATATLYGVVRMQQPAGLPSYTVVALHWPGNQIWRSRPIPARALTPVSVAPDGTLLVAASAPVSGGAASLYALDPQGRVRWRVPLAPGRPSTVSVQGAGGGWVAWVAVAGAMRSWVDVVDSGGHALWRWSTGHSLDERVGGVSLTHPASSLAVPSGPAYVGSSIGVYALDLRRRHAWLFFDARAQGAGATGPPTTDASKTVYVGTASGRVYDIYPSGRIRWSYATGRDARGVVTLAPDGTALVVSHDAAGGDVVEALGVGGQSLQTVGPSLCAPPDCPTATATPTASVTASATVPPSPSASTTSTVSPASATVTPSG